jgi:hypothetical protein
MMIELAGRFGRLILPTLVLGFAWAGPTAAQEAAPPQRLVEVPIRVVVDGRFAEDLILADFEILENGRVQRPEGLCLVKGQNVVRREAGAPDPVRSDRHFYLLFQTVDYDVKLAGAMDYLFQNVLKPGDAMTLVTPMKAYALSAEALLKKPKASLSKEMQQILRKDIQAGSGEYRNLLADLRRIVKGIGGDSGVDDDMETDAATSQFGLEMNLDRYKQSLIKVEQIRLIDERRLTALAAGLKQIPSRKFVYFFYQREFRPEISPQAMNVMMSMYQDQPNVMSDLTDLFNLYRRESTFRLENVKRAFADAAACFNFIFMNKESKYIFGAFLREQSEDAFQTFTEIARATGGVSDNSPDSATAFRNAIGGTLDYYLLYYAPDVPPEDGGFRTIAIRLKGRPGNVTNRLGYFAR